MPTLDLKPLPSLSLSPPLADREKEKGAAVYLPLCNHRIWEKSFSSCRFQFGLEGKGGARGDLQNPLPLNSTSRRPKPPVKARHPAGTLAPAPPRSDSGQKPPRRPGHRHAHHGHPSSASKPPSIPRLVTSPSSPSARAEPIPQGAATIEPTVHST
jgi:hypothetical protein